MGCSGLKQVLVFFEERFQQRDRDCEAARAFIRTKVCVEEHPGRLRVSYAL